VRAGAARAGARFTAVKVQKPQYLITGHVRARRGGRRLIIHASFDPAAIAVLRLAALALLAAFLLRLFR
jgi:hypothetical protein